ncbi:MAG: transcriptional repressor [Actinomycetota bacterium]|nr:transcriptional repressor [Actinomycetota bacterium]
MTPQRRAIVVEIMRTRGHISPQKIVDRVEKRLPGTNPSTVYRTLELLEELGIVSHAHLGDGPEYHKADEHDHVHLICSRCNKAQSLSEDDTTPLKELISRHSGFVPDFTHFAISGLCADCRQREG